MSINSFNYNLAVIDAWGRAPSGVGQMKIYWLGDQDQCRAAKAFNQDGSQTFQGRYCKANVTMLYFFLVMHFI